MRPLRQSTDPAMILRAAGWDAGNRSMRKAGRTTWNGADLDAAIAQMDRLCAAWADERDAAAAERVASECTRLEAAHV